MRGAHPSTLRQKESNSNFFEGFRTAWNLPSLVACAVGRCRPHFRGEVAVLLFELFPRFYLVSGFTLVAGVTGMALFIADRRARRDEQEMVTA